jgi:ribosome-binding factor A
MNERNKGRIEETIRQIVAELLMRKVKDPRVADVSVLRVEVSRDYSVAKIFYNLIGGSEPARIEDAGRGLSSGKGFMRRFIRKHLRLRVIPELVFIYDSSLDRAMHIEEMIDRIHEEEKEGPRAGGGPGGGEDTG